jgi:uncharacterized membrane protein
MVGHAIHPMLVVFPLGLLTTAVIFDLIYLFTDRESFAVAAAYAIGAGVIGGLFAAAAGWIDWTKVPNGTRAKRIGTVHGTGNMVVMLLFALSWLLRANATRWEPDALALTCSFAGVVLAGGTAWLGGELVERLGVGVDDGANLDAPSSLSHRPATDRPTAGPTTRPAR